MSLAVFNINDAGIQVSVDGDLVRTSPGYAVLDGNRLMIGEQACLNAKLLPRWTNNRFWSQLNTNPLPNNSNDIRHHADLAFAHLEDLWLPIKKDVSDTVFIVPGYYSNENLGLLLGLSKECGLPVKGIVDQSIISACNLPLHSNVLHLDIHLHSISLTRISNTGTLIRKDVKNILETGLYTLMDRWANIIAGQFIQSTRFDPMHNADSEQQLFNKLPAWISSLDGDTTHSFQLTVEQTEHTIAISNDNLLKACTPLYPQIVGAVRNEISGNEQTSLLVSHRFSGFPGLNDSLRLIPDINIIDLNELKSIASATLHQGEIVSESGAVNHMIQLSAGEVADQPEAPQPAKATHLLWRHRAIAIGKGFPLGHDLSNGPTPSNDPVCTVYPRDGQLMLESSRAGAVRVNGQTVTEMMTLEPGDQLEVADEIMTLILVSSETAR